MMFSFISTWFDKPSQLRQYCGIVMTKLSERYISGVLKKVVYAWNASIQIL